MLASIALGATTAKNIWRYAKTMFEIKMIAIMGRNDKDQLSHQQPGKKAHINMFYDLGKKVTHINNFNFSGKKAH